MSHKNQSVIIWSGQHAATANPIGRQRCALGLLTSCRGDTGISHRVFFFFFLLPSVVARVKDKGSLNTDALCSQSGAKSRQECREQNPHDEADAV